MSKHVKGRGGNPHQQGKRTPTAGERLSRLEEVMMSHHMGIQGMARVITTLADEANIEEFREHERSPKEYESMQMVPYTNLFYDNNRLVKVIPLTSYTKTAHDDNNWIFTVDSDSYSYAKRTYTDEPAAYRRLMEDIQKKDLNIEVVPQGSKKI